MYHTALAIAPVEWGKWADKRQLLHRECFQTTRKRPNMRASQSVGYDHANPSQKSRPRPGTDWACDGGRGKRTICRCLRWIDRHAIHVARFTSQGFLLIMMLSGAIGFYLGIDTPAQTFEHGPDRKVDAAEFLSAAGTFLATLTAFVSVGVILLRANPHIFWTIVMILGWTIGVIMQIVAGAIARFHA
jgi:hypothetical protein